MFERLSWVDSYVFCTDDDCNGTITLNTTNDFMAEFYAANHCNDVVDFDECPDAKDKPW